MYACPVLLHRHHQSNVTKYELWLQKLVNQNQIVSVPMFWRKIQTCFDIDCSVWKKPAYCVGAQEQLSVVQNEEMLCKHLLCAHYFAFMYIILSSPLFRLPVVLSTGLWSRCIAAAWHDSSLSIVSNSSSPLLLFSSSVMLKVRQWTVFYSLL